MRIWICLAGMLVSACASSGPPTMWTRSGITMQEYQADADACLERASAARNSVAYQGAYSPPSAGAAGAMGAAFGAGLARGFAQGEAMRRASEQCYKELGYVEAPISAEDQRALRAAPRDGVERVRIFYDLATRVAPPAPPVETHAPPNAEIVVEEIVGPGGATASPPADATNATGEPPTAPAEEPGN